MINIEKIEVDIARSGHITNTYLIYDDNKNAVLIDPGFDSDKIINKIIELNLVVEKIIITHAHADHIGALEKLQLYTKAKIIIHENDFKSLINEEENYNEMLNVEHQYLNKEDIEKVIDGMEFKIGKMNFEIIHTPGHTSGCICILEKTSNRLITGDTLFSDCYGRCDLHSASFDDMVKSMKKLFNRFENIMIYPGHGEIVNIDSVKKRIRILFSFKGAKLD